jgi:hypothetical protein
LVNVVEDWKVLEEYAGEKLGFYQINGVCGKVEIRVVTGKIGFKQEYEDANDKEFVRIRDFCEKRHFIRISENVRDEAFFK